MDASYQSFDLPSESESDVSEDGFSILPSLQTNKIGIKWSIGNKIALYDVKSRYDKPSVQSDASQAPTLVVGCSWNHARFARRVRTSAKLKDN